MNINLVNLLADASEEDLQGFFAEEFAVATAFCHSGAARERAEALEQKALEWAAVISPPERATEGSRQQPLLRQLIDDLQGGKQSELHWDEITFLMAACELMKSANDTAQFKRPIELLEPHIEAMRIRVAGLEPDTGLVHLQKRIAVISAADIRKAPSLEIRKFAGVDITFRGPVFRHRGFLKIVGSVPDSCAVVVEEGSCYVNGFVQGKIAVTGNCEVRETISGMVVSGQRAVRARGIITPAVVIAKAGRVGCFMTQAPKLVYAGNQIRIADTAVQGAYFAPRIRVNCAAEGGEWHISAAMRCGVYVHSDSRPLAIIFRRSLSCLDYGEAIPNSARALLSASTRLLTHSEYLEQTLRVQKEDLNLLAENILTYLSCGEQVQALLGQIETLKGRILILDRIILGVGLLKRYASERARPSGGLAGVTEGDAELDNSIRDLEAEVRALMKEEGTPRELQHTWDTILAQFNTIGNHASTPKIARIMENTQKSMRAWSKQRSTLLDELEEVRQKLSGATGSVALLERARESKNVIGVLHQVLKAALSKDPDTPLGLRARSPITARMVRTLQQRNDRLRRCEGELQRERQRVREISTQLESEFHLPLPGQEECIQVVGRFEGGGTIAYNGHRQMVDMELLENRIALTDSNRGVVTYRCDRQGEIEFVAEESAVVIEE